MSHRFSAGNFTPDEEESWEDSYSEDTFDDDDPYGCFMDDDTIERKISSAMDCTGLIPSLPHSEEELEAYAELYRYSGDVFQD